MTAPDRALLSALAAEATDMRARLDGVAELVGELIQRLPDEAERRAALAPAQSLDLLGQRLDALAGVLDGLASGQAPARLVAAVPLSDMAARLGADVAAAPAHLGAGDLHLFE